jgi:transcriptional regulator with XRE-family HTH domain
LVTIDYSKLRGKIREVYGSESECAKAMGISRATMSYKLTGKQAFSQSDIIKLSGLLGISADDYGVYYFCPKS